ncbi:phospho-sugar mutase [Schlesneria paludicola]|uniref:phospho-sugar mutase n=1 Tax=Schlesneria paludicola TaxID=360056 RepID=UPI0002F61EFC|nr:phospho-sugar mutase [Schlesneria paludicola]
MSFVEGERVSAAGRIVKSAIEDGRLLLAAGQNLTRWLSEPYYADYRPKLLTLIEQSAFDELNRLFWERIPFGTGGRRGPMSEFGSATINARTIAESAQGLAVYVRQVARESGSFSDQRKLRAVVARDTRHRSTEFARLTASILAANGFEVFYFPEPRATPELSFAVRNLHCDTGVMISASHNPPSDNGFKAYWSTGGQVLPPHDAGIIGCVDACQEIPAADFEQAVSAGQIVLLTEKGDVPRVDQAYIDAVCSLSVSPARDVKALYTPMHGVGESSIYRVLQHAGFEGVELFEPQRVQDGSFPNVPDHLPNPERPQALQPAIDYAREHGHALVLASDPDADRLAVAVRTSGDQFVCLTGNQFGALLADFVLSRRAAQGTLSPGHYIVETLVTTPMLQAIARAFGVRAISDLLVGFKYIAAAMDEHGPDKFVFAAEESVGYLAGEYCRDKDACVAALFGLELASELQRQGKTLVDRLDELYVEHGYYHETQFVQVCPGPEGNAQITRMMLALREKAPTKLGSVVFATARDFLRHEVRSLPSNTTKSQLPYPSGDLLILEGTSGPCRVSLAGRPSGTEPKIKFYLFTNCSTELPLDQAKAAARKCLSELESGLKQWLVSNAT